MLMHEGLSFNFPFRIISDLQYILFRKTKKFWMANQNKNQAQVSLIEEASNQNYIKMQELNFNQQFKPIRNLVEADGSLSHQRTVQKEPTFMSKEDTLNFITLYKQHNSNWELYSSKLPFKKPNQIKNFFHNSIRNLALRLQKAEKSNKKFQRNVINTSSLHLILNITLGFKNFQGKVEEKYKKLLIFSVYDFILYHCFENVEAAEEELFQLCRVIRKLKGFFKVLQNLKKKVTDDEYMFKIIKKLYKIEFGNQINEDEGQQKSQIQDAQVKKEEGLGEKDFVSKTESYQSQMKNISFYPQGYQNWNLIYARMAAFYQGYNGFPHYNYY